MTLATLDYPDTAAMRPYQASWNLFDASKVQSSAFTGHTQSLQLSGTRWMAELSFTNKNRDELHYLAAWFAGLKGQQTIFNLWDHSVEIPRGAANPPPPDGTGTYEGSPVAFYNSNVTQPQIGYTLWTKAWGAAYDENNPLLLKGDYISYYNPYTFTYSMHKIVGSYVLNGSTGAIESSGGDYVYNSQAMWHNVVSYTVGAEHWAAISVVPPIRTSPVKAEDAGTEEIDITQPLILVKPKASMILTSNPSIGWQVRSRADASITVSMMEYLP